MAINPFTLPLWSVPIQLVFLYVIGDLFLKKLRNANRNPLPPGPKGLPILGSLSDFPRVWDSAHWSKHKQLYGSCSVVAF